MGTKKEKIQFHCNSEKISFCTVYQNENNQNLMGNMLVYLCIFLRHPVSDQYCCSISSEFMVNNLASLNENRGASHVSDDFCIMEVRTLQLRF